LRIELNSEKSCKSCLSPEQRLQLERAGQIQLPGSPEWLRATNGRVTLKFDLPRQGLSLLKLTW